MTVPGSDNTSDNNAPRYGTTTGAPEPAEPEEEPQVVVRDRRKVDPDTGTMRTDEQAAATEAAAEAEIVPGPSDTPQDPTEIKPGPQGDPDAARQLEERTADLQRLQAEYANYRRRVERERDAAASNAKAGLVGELLTVLDDVERAEAHGDLTGPFKAVADKLGSALQHAGLEAFGSENEPFDPTVHEAVQHDTSPEVSGPTVTTVLRKGYRIGEKVVRNALVAVTDHEAPAAGEPVGEPVDGQATAAVPDGDEPATNQ